MIRFLVLAGNWVSGAAELRCRAAFREGGIGVRGGGFRPDFWWCCGSIVVV